MIEFRDVSFSYGALQGQASVRAVSRLSFSVEKASHIALIGRNGSGKSTIARLMNGLLLPDEGEVWVDGKLTADEAALYEIRRQCGMVFQNPDNQIIGTTVKDDITFGPSNLGLPREEIFRRLDQALVVTGLSDLRDRSPHELSGGQKQKLALASVLAMRPDCIILDEATSMLDPAARSEIRDLISELRQSFGLTVIQITHHMEEALLADYVYVISDGAIAFEGIPARVFDQVDRLRGEGMAVPSHLEIAQTVSRATGLPYDPEELINFDGAVDYVRSALAGRRPAKAPAPVPEEFEGTGGDRSPVIVVNGLSYAYDSETGRPLPALEDISLTVEGGEVLGIAGHTGSGKSTLIQHLNGLIPSEAGTVLVLGRDLSQRKVIRDIRRQVGLLFQYPEDQLFEETVALDIAFAPKQQKKTPQEVERAVLRAADRLGITGILDRSPFELSGGQRRRAAIAGVLAAEPDIVILDEPAAGLDPAACEELFADLLTLSAEGATLIIVSHDMETLSRIANRLVILKEGRVAGLGSPAEITEETSFLEEVHLEMPAPRRFLKALSDLFPELDTARFSVADAAGALLAAAGVKAHA